MTFISGAELGLPTVQNFSGSSGISWCCPEKGDWPFRTVQWPEKSSHCYRL